MGSSPGRLSRSRASEACNVQCSEPDCISVRGAAYLRRDAHPVSIGVKPVCRPLGRGCKVELVISGDWANSKRKPRSRYVAKAHQSASPRPLGGRAQFADPAGDEIGQHQTAVGAAHDFRLDARHCRAERIRMKLQCHAHAAIVAARLCLEHEACAQRPSRAQVPARLPMRSNRPSRPAKTGSTPMPRTTLASRIFRPIQSSPL